MVVVEWLFPCLHPLRRQSFKVSSAFCFFCALYLLLNNTRFVTSVCLSGLVFRARDDIVCIPLDTVTLPHFPGERLWCTVVEIVSSTAFVFTLALGRPRLVLPVFFVLRPRFLPILVVKKNSKIQQRLPRIPVTPIFERIKSSKNCSTKPCDWLSSLTSTNQQVHISSTARSRNSPVLGTGFLRDNYKLNFELSLLYGN